MERRVGELCGGRLPRRASRLPLRPPPSQRIFLPPPPPEGGCPPNYIRNPVPPYDCLPPTPTEHEARPRGPSRPQTCPPGWIGQPPNCLPPTPTGKTCPPGKIPRPVAPYDCITDVIAAGLTFGPSSTSTPKLPQPPPIPASEIPSLRGFNLNPWRPSQVHRLMGLAGPQLGIMQCYSPDGSVVGIADVAACPPGTSPTPPATTAPPPPTAPTAPTTVTSQTTDTSTVIQPGVMPTSGIQQQLFFGPSAGIPVVPIGVPPAVKAQAPAPVPATVPCPPSPTILQEPAVAGIPVVPVTGVLLVGAIAYLLLS